MRIQNRFSFPWLSGVEWNKKKLEKHTVTHFSISFLPCRQKNSFVQKNREPICFPASFKHIYIPVEILTNKVYLSKILLKYFISLNFFWLWWGNKRKIEKISFCRHEKLHVMPPKKKCLEHNNFFLHPMTKFSEIHFIPMCE